MHVEAAKKLSQVCNTVLCSRPSKQVGTKTYRHNSSYYSVYLVGGQFKEGRCCGVTDN